MGVRDTVGDALTHDIWNDKTKKVTQRSAVRSASPNREGIPNLRVEFHEDIIDQEEPEIVVSSNILDQPALMCPPPASKKEERIERDHAGKHTC